MPKYEHRVYRVKPKWDGGKYYLAVMAEADRWSNADHLAEKGWEFVAFVPDHEVYVKDSFTESELKFVRLAVFKRQLDEGEEMDCGAGRAL